MTTTTASTVIAATDGSALGNPGPAGWAYYIDEGSWAAGSFTRATNNAAELQAVLELLRALPGDVDVQIRADSQYVINALYGTGGRKAWVHGWKRKGWKTASGTPVANREVIAEIADRMATRPGRTEFVWVRAHQARGGDPWNEAADARAFEAAKAAQAGRPAAAGPGYRR
jgi:ribonuclease HI